MSKYTLPKAESETGSLLFQGWVGWWVVGWVVWKNREYQLPTKLKLKLKLSLAIMNDSWARREGKMCPLILIVM